MISPSLNGITSLGNRLTRILIALGFVAMAVLAWAAPAQAQQADLVVNQADSPDPGPAGGVFTYTVRVDNNGPNPATAVTLSNTLPPGSTFVGVTATPGSCTESAGTVSCALGNLAFLATATVAIQVRLPTAGVWTNTATATSATPDPNPSNNVNVTEGTTAQIAADMTLTVADAPDPVAAGGPYAYTVTARNNGPNGLGATDTQTIAFTVPTGACITAAPTGTGWSCTATPSGYPRCTGSSISCTRTGALASGNNAPALTVPAVANVSGSITAAFQVSSSLPDGNPADNTVTATTTVTGDSSDVSIAKAASSSTVEVGSNVTFTLTPRHNGGEPPGTLAPNLITVVDTLPTGLTFVSASGSGWDCAFAAPEVTCTRPGPYTGGNFTNMPPISIVATANTAGPLSNTATITAPETDPIPGNNTATVNITASNDADLRMTKTASLNPVVPNQNFTYTLTTRNLGPLAIRSTNTITVTDTLPAGLTLRSQPTGSGWSCSPPSGFPITGPIPITCTRPGPLAVNADAPAITVPVVATTAGTLVNNACVALSGTGPSDNNSANNCASRSVTSTDIGLAADLEVVSKTASPNPVLAGQDLTYVITARNNGPGNATNATVTDTLASLVGAGGFQSATPSQGSCTPSGVTAGPSVALSCNLGTLSNGTTATITVVVRPSIATTGNRTNTAAITSPDVGDPDRSNNSAAVTSAVTAVADATVTKTATPSPVRAGTPLTYVITARNNGPSTASSVVATDTLPTNAAFISLGTVTGSGNCTTPAADAVGGTLTCTWASTTSGTQQTATFRVRPLTSAANGNVDNSVAITTTTLESNSNNNAAAISTPVTEAQVDILVNKVDSIDPVALGQSTVYTVTTTNGGPSFATNVEMVDTFPTSSPTATFSYQGSLTISPAGIGTCVEPAIGATSGTLTCTFPGIANGASAVVTYAMRAESIASGVSGTTFNNAAVTATEPETLPNNNQTTHATTSRRAADLSLIKSAPATVIPGATVDWTLAVTNNGPNPSTGAVVTDVLPGGVVFQSASSGCVFTESSRTVTCTLGTLAPSASTTLTINVLTTSPYTGANPLVNSASVATANEIDPVPGNNSATRSSTVGPEADLYISKSSNPNPYIPGETLTYTLTVGNAGPSDVTDARIQDVLPGPLSAFTWTCAAGGGGSCGTASGSGSIDVRVSLPTGASATFTVTGIVPAGTTGPLTNTATVTPPTGVTDPVPGNNQAEDTNPIGPRADLSITKSSTPNPYVSGATLTYTIVARNAGPDAANNARVQDVLPGPLSAFTWTCAAGGGGSCGTASGSGSIDARVSLPDNASATFTVTGTVPSGTTGPLTNTATVTPPAGVTDPAPGNNRADDTNPVDSRTGTVTGVVYQDNNGNGVRDPGEPGIPGVQVAITDSTSAVAIATTDANGAYSRVVPAGATIIDIDEATLPPGLTRTQGTNPTTVTVPPGGAASDVDGFSPATPPPPPPPNNGAVSGTVFNDLNGSSVQDPGETGLSGVTIELLDNNGNVVATATTGVNGSYSFPNVPPGAYTVRETDPTGFTSTTLNTLPISVAPGGAAIANFGNQPQGSVSGTVFNDLNGNGVQDPGETGLGGVTVTLTPTSGGPSVTTTTTSNGSYLFTAVAPGSYTVTEADPTDFISTTNNTVPVSVPSGGAATANFGDQQQGTISGVVFNDFNGNGVRDRGEPGISGVTIELLDSTGRVIATTTTTGDGRYLFTSLNPGTYTVRETDPTGFVSTTPNTGTATVPPGGIASPDFGDQQIRTISGVVFNDLNGNGVQDPGEPGIGGVTVVLRDDAQGTTIQTTTTGSDGRYLFNNIAPGSYTVQATDPSGYTSTTPNRVAVTIPPNGAASANFGDQPSSSALFDPPSGRKTVNTAGFPVIEWRMVWINGSNTAANRVRVIDPVPVGAIYDPDSLRCEARGQSTIATCVFEPANNRVVYEGNIAADPGALDETDAQNEVVIVFNTLLQSGVSTVENLASAHWDRNGNGSVDDDITGNQLPVETNNGQPVRPPVDIPLLAPWLFWMLAGLLALMGAVARQNSGWFKKVRRQN